MLVRCTSLVALKGENEMKCMFHTNVNCEWCVPAVTVTSLEDCIAEQNYSEEKMSETKSLLYVPRANDTYDSIKRLAESKNFGFTAESYSVDGVVMIINMRAAEIMTPDWSFGEVPKPLGSTRGLSLIHISEPTRQAEIS